MISSWPLTQTGLMLRLAVWVWGVSWPELARTEGCPNLNTLTSAHLEIQFFVSPAPRVSQGPADWGDGETGGHCVLAQLTRARQDRGLPESEKCEHMDTILKRILMIFCLQSVRKISVHCSPASGRRGQWHRGPGGGGHDGGGHRGAGGGGDGQ